MRTFEIINPSDHYTIMCPDLEIAAVACILLGEGKYAFDAGDDQQGVPLFLFGGHDEWFVEQFGANVETVTSRVLADRRGTLADAFDSVLIGRREAFDALAPARGTDDWKEARAKWHDAHRSSLNDIGGLAYSYAARLREDAVPA